MFQRNFIHSWEVNGITRCILSVVLLVTRMITNSGTLWTSSFYE